MSVFRNVDRLSWLWLAIGAILLFFSSLQPSLPIAAWLAPIFLLRFARTQRPLIGLALLALVMCGVSYAKWSTGFAPVTMLGIRGVIAALEQPTPHLLPSCKTPWRRLTRFNV